MESKKIYSHKLTKTEVDYYVVSLGGISEITNRDYGKSINVLDDMDNKYPVRISKSTARIDGLSKWFKKYLPNKNDLIYIRIINDNEFHLSLKKTLNDKEEKQEIPKVTESLGITKRYEELTKWIKANPLRSAFIAFLITVISNFISSLLLELIKI